MEYSVGQSALKKIFSETNFQKIRPAVTEQLEKIAAQQVSLLAA